MIQFILGRLLLAAIVVLTMMLMVDLSDLL
jgi:hypothetical protein